MSKTKKYQVLWRCPHCGNDHTWWWESQWEAFDEGVTDMVCDRCDARVKCKGDGFGYYEPVKDEPIETRIKELVDLNTDVHNYCRSLEDKVNREVKDLYDGLNALAKRVIELENRSKPKSKREPNFLDLIHSEKAPFYERFREGCEFNEETMPGESIAKILRFIAVEVERMTERDMGGSFTVSNLTVGKNLRELADEAEIEG